METQQEKAQVAQKLAKTGTLTNESQHSPDRRTNLGPGIHVATSAHHPYALAVLPMGPPHHGYDQVRYGVGHFDYALKMPLQQMASMEWFQSFSSQPPGFPRDQLMRWTYSPHGVPGAHLSSCYDNQVDTSRDIGMQDSVQRRHGIKLNAANERIVEQTPGEESLMENSDLFDRGTGSSAVSRQPVMPVYGEGQKVPVYLQRQRSRPKATMGPQNTSPQLHAVPGLPTYVTAKAKTQLKTDTNNNHHSGLSDREPQNESKRPTTHSKLQKSRFQGDNIYRGGRKPSTNAYDNIQMLASMAVQRSEDNCIPQDDDDLKKVEMKSPGRSDHVRYPASSVQKNNVGKTLGCLVEHIIQQTVPSDDNGSSDASVENKEHTRDSEGSYQTKDKNREVRGSPPRVVGKNRKSDSSTKTVTKGNGDSSLTFSEVSCSDSVSRQRGKRALSYQTPPLHKGNSYQSCDQTLHERSVDNCCHRNLPATEQQQMHLNDPNQVNTVKRRGTENSAEKHLPAKKRRICHINDIASKDYWMCTPRDTSIDLDVNNDTHGQNDSHHGNDKHNSHHDNSQQHNHHGHTSTSASIHVATLPFTQKVQSYHYPQDRFTFPQEAFPDKLTGLGNVSMENQSIPAFKLGYNSMRNFWSQRPGPQPTVFSFPPRYQPCQSSTQQEPMPAVPYPSYPWQSRYLPHTGYHGYVNASLSGHSHYKEAYEGGSEVDGCKSGEFDESVNNSTKTI